jgi:cytidyltransferase-like protein
MPDALPAKNMRMEMAMKRCESCGHASLIWNPKTQLHHCFSPDCLATYEESVPPNGHQDVLVYTCGCFDPLTANHVRLLNVAAGYGSVIVGVNNDASVRALKGEGRPLQGFPDRREVLLSLKSVRAVVEQGRDAVANLTAIRPSYFIKGGYVDRDVTEDEYREGIRRLSPDERDTCNAIGCEVILVPRFPGKSSSEIIRLLLRESR